MNHTLIWLVVLVGVLSVPGSAVFAASCSTWNWQSDGVYWRTCVNDDGSQQCYQATDESGSNAREVPC